MPRNDSLPTLVCNLCSLTTKNHFIFSRHRQRCIRIHKGTAVARREGPGTVDKSRLSSEWEDVGEEDRSEVSMEEKSAEKPAEDVSQKTAGAKSKKSLSRLRNRSAPETESEIETTCQVSGASDGKAPGVAAGISKSDSSLRQILEEEGKSVEGRVEKDMLDVSTSSQRVPPPVSRNYSCEVCAFTTNRSRDFLYHKKELHNARIKVYSCVVCEYSSAFKHKIQRHMAQIHYIHLKINEVFAEGDPRGSTAAAVSLAVPNSNSSPQAQPKVPLKHASKTQKVVSSKAIPRSKQTRLDSLLLKLRSKNASEAKVSALIDGAGDCSSFVESGTGNLYKCKLCLFTGSNKNKVRRHLQACHLNVKPFKCSLCSFETVSKMDFYAHKKKHTGSNNTTVFKCKECDYATEFRPNFDRHMLRHGCNKPVKCSLCSYATDHEGALKRHVTSHHANTTKNQSLLMSGDNAQASREDVKVVGQGEYEASVEDGGLETLKHRCPVCVCKYTRSSDLSRHMKNKHVISRKEYYRQHGRPDNCLDDEDDDDDDDEEEVLDLKDLEDDMDVEEMSISDEDRLLQSSDFRPSQTDSSQVEKRINKKCSYCSYIARWAGDLRRHMRVHSVVKRFKCSLCCKEYKYLGDLNVHMRRDHESFKTVVSPEDLSVAPEKVATVARKKSSPRLFRCPACLFSTKIKIEMDRHSQQHTEEKTYSCKLCSYQTYWRGDMGRHLYRRHPEDVKNDADVKNFFIFRPERRAISKGGKAVSESADNFENILEPETHAEETVVPAEEEKPEEEESFSCDSRERIKISIEEMPSEALEEAINNGPEVAKDPDGNRIYHCSVCLYSHAQLHKVKNHMDIHLNLKQYQCPLCGQRGNWKYDVSKHMQSKHPGSSLKVITLTPEEAKATIHDYLASHPSIKRDYSTLLSPSPTKGSTPSSVPSSPHKPADTEKKAGLKSVFDVLGKTLASLPKQKGKKVSSLSTSGRKARVFEYKCSHCQFRSSQRFNVSKHQREEHDGQPGLGILAKTLFIKMEDKRGESKEGEQLANRTSEADDDVRGTRSGVDNPLQDNSKSVDAGPVLAQTELEQEEEEESQDGAALPYRCAQCGKQGSSKGSIKKHYNYIHPNSEVRIVSVADGVEFNYYTGLPATDSVPCPPVCDSKAPPAVARPPTPNEESGSKLNDPKKHGYVKPFQCSVCGQRSNWKWDIKKHLRFKHPDDCGFIIVLQLDEARATCDSYTRPKADGKDSLTIRSVGVGESIVSEKADLSSSESSCPASPAKSPAVLGTPYKTQEMLLGRYRRYKCSVCGYRSNWRTDICRHIERRHSCDSQAKVIFMGVEEARDTFMDYEYNPPNTTPGASGAVASPLKRTPTPQEAASPSASPFKVPSPVKPLPSSRKPVQTGKAWHCPKCPFVSTLKSHIVAHMQEHGMKPFLCTACGTTARFRSPLYRHIRKQHNSTNYNAFAKIVIKFNKTPPLARGKFVDKVVEAFLCRLCTGNAMECETEGQMMDHLLSQHASVDPSQALRIKKAVGQGEGEQGSCKQFMCLICPYRTEKRNMLTFHHSYHQPSPQNKYKCRLCPYYVCASRLLHQHMKVHSEFEEDNDDDFEAPGWPRQQENRTPPSSPSKRTGSTGEGTPKRHTCPKCPYSTNSKNDFLYHKQFHRPKPAAEYKCEHCDYWVTHKRLLKQHAKLHGEDWDEDSLCLSPTKSLASDASAVLDAVEIAAIKQKMISNKIAASLSATPSFSPMKMMSGVAAGASNRPGFVLHNGVYKKLHQCGKCPYTNIRLRNLRLHQQMHGFRKASYPLLKCPHCDYLVGSRGLLSHHMKVHQKQYRYDVCDSTFDLEKQECIPGMSKILSEPDDENEQSVLSQEIPQQRKVDTLLEISRYKKYSCEKCPYSSGKRSHFVRHLELHGSRQRHSCLYCDYSVPSVSLLQQHQKIHMMPNQNLLATQSFSNLQHLREVPADVALASALPPSDSAEPVTISVVHDHLELYENDDNNSLSAEPRKLYRCDRCPYANVRRDHLLTHMRFHLTASPFHCPYCDYSAPKQQLLTQHLRVHFCPLPELSDWLIENGQGERAQEVSERVEVDIGQAVKEAERLQGSRLKRKLNAEQLSQLQAQGLPEVATKKARENEVKVSTSDTNIKTDAICVSKLDETGEGVAKSEVSDCKPEEKKDDNMYICQYCDREFPTSKLLIAHELLHLIGNHCEQTAYVHKFADETATDTVCTTACPRSSQKTPEEQENRQHVEIAEIPKNSVNTESASVAKNEQKMEVVVDTAEGKQKNGGKDTKSKEFETGIRDYKGHNSVGIEVPDVKSDRESAVTTKEIEERAVCGKKGESVVFEEDDLKDGPLEQNAADSMEVCDGEKIEDREDKQTTVRKLRSRRGINIVD